MKVSCCRQFECQRAIV